MIFLFYVQNVHQGYIVETLERFLKARDGNVARAHKMVQFLPLVEMIIIYIVKHLFPKLMDDYCVNQQLVDSLHWRLENGIDDILSVSVFYIVIF